MSGLPPDLQKPVSKLLGSGNYSSEEDILRPAITALEERNADLASIQAGVRDMETSRYRPFSEFDADFRKRNQVE
jgi:Arc/MetJ-type ribon-helix-helix transcriptional regulator